MGIGTLRQSKQSVFHRMKWEGKVGKGSEINAKFIRVTFVYSQSTEATLTVYKQEISNGSDDLVINNGSIAPTALNNQAAYWSAWFKQKEDR